MLKILFGIWNHNINQNVLNRINIMSDIQSNVVNRVRMF